ncbi:MAG: colanic acid biosynthesis acetyltransferase WcaF [Candidatus Riflebacteria bacterium]|nr:colanic acid biosynthesis acetyltransferase WcaF [Candidatus Riflebacteria bacterium]
MNTNLCKVDIAATAKSEREATSVARPRYQDLSRFRLPENFRGRPAWVVQLWWLIQATLFRLSPQMLYGWRRFLLRLFGACVGDEVLIRPTVTFTYPWKVTIGDRSWIGDDVCLYSLGEIRIGSDTVVSQRTYICTGSHEIDRPAFDIFSKPVHIGDEVWLAADVFVAPGVTIGDGCVVGARSTVFCDLPSGMICRGVPAVPIRSRPYQPVI